MIFETYDKYYQKYNLFFLISEKIYLCIYIVECCLKLWVDKEKKNERILIEINFDHLGIFMEIF